MTQRKPSLRAYGMALFLVALGLAVGSASAAMRPDTRAKFVAMAALTPAEAQYAVLAADASQALRRADALLRQYGQASSTFQYDQLRQTIVGAFGYNLLNPEELSRAGIDPARGFVAFALKPDAPPLIALFVRDAPAALAAAGVLARSLGAPTACPGPAVGAAKTVHYRLKCDGPGETALSVATLGDRLLLMPYPENADGFQRCVAALADLKPEAALSRRADFAKLLDRLEDDPVLIQVGHYGRLLDELNLNLDALKGQLERQPDGAAQAQAVGEAGVALELAQNYDGQIFALSLAEKRIAATWAMTGQPDKLQSFNALFAPRGASMLAGLRLNPHPLGMLYAVADGAALVERFFNKPGGNAGYAQLVAAFKQDLGLDIDADLLQPSSGEALALLYGVNPLEPGVCQGKGLSEADLFRHYQLVFVVGFRDAAAPAKLTERINAFQKREGVALTVVSADGKKFQQSEKDGVVVQYGAEGSVFYLAFGPGALQAALSDRRPLDLAPLKNRTLYLHLDLPRAVAAMNALRPAATCANTQIHQVFKMWEGEVKPGLAALESLTLYARPGRDGLTLRADVVMK